MVKKKRPVKKATESNEVSSRVVEIPRLEIAESIILIEGSTPLLMNNKGPAGKVVAEEYRHGKAKFVGKRLKDYSDKERYAMAFYVTPNSKFDPPSPKGAYGIPASGLKKCLDKAIRCTGESNNTVIGQIAKSFFVPADEDSGGLCLIKFNPKDLIRDARLVNVGSGQKTVPQMRYRPLFKKWSCSVKVRYNTKSISIESLVNLFMYAGMYIGLCELRAEKKQGQCGGFVVANHKTK